MRGSDGWGPPCHSDTDFVEMDPSGRYGRYHEVLGKGASKVVYKAFDSVLGMEVAWNQIKIDNTNSRPEDMERLCAEVALLQTLKHKNVMRFHASWVNAEYGSVNFITEMFTSGTLREYRQKHRHADITAIKHWARQILHGLAYLHSQDPPVVHRDIKCDNIFVNGHLGEVKIGDLGFATILTENLAAHCVIGTPEFMAPELYSQEYNELVDVYAFGMCLLELLTFEYPYSECFKPAQIFKKVTSGVKPEALYKITDPDARQFVEKCLSAVSERPSARILLLDPFLSNDYLDSLDIFSSHSNVDDYEFIESEQIENLGYRRLQLMDSFHGGRNDYGNSPGTRKSLSTSSHRGQNLIITGSRSEDNEIYLQVRIAYKGKAKNIHFPFDIESDTPMTVAEEMVTELEITDHDVHEIADMINKAVSALIVDEERKLMVERDEADEVIHSEYKMGGNDFMLSPASSENSFFNYFMVPNLLNKQTGMAKSSTAEDAVHGSSEQVLNQRKKIDVPIMAKEKQKTSAESLDLYQDADEWFDQELHCPPYSPISSCSEDVKFLPYNESHSDLGSYYTKCISSSTNSASNSQSACQLQLSKETHETVPQCSISTHSTSQNASMSEGIHSDLECEGFSDSVRMPQHRNLLPSNILDKHDDNPFENDSRLRVSTSKKELKELQTRLRYSAHGSRDNLLMEKLPSSFCTGSKVSFLSKERRPNRIMMKNLKSFQKLNEEQLERWYRDWKAAYEGLPRRGSRMVFPSSNKITSNLNALEPINFSRNQGKFPMGFAHSLSEREKLMGKRRLTKNYSFNDLRGSSNLKSIAADLSKLRLYHTVGTVNSEKVRANENTS